MKCASEQRSFRGHRVLPAVALVLATAVLMLTGVACTETGTVKPDQPVTQFRVFFNNDTLTGGRTECDAVFPVARATPASPDPVATALESLFLGPSTAERARGYRSFFSQRTVNLLKRVQIKSGTAYVDLRDQRSELAGATSSCGSAEFLSQILRTLGEFPDVNRVIFAIEGDPAQFYDWLEMECAPSNDNCNPAPFASP